METLKITVDIQDKAAVINLAGSADNTACEDIVRQTKLLLENNQTNLIINMNDLTFICSMVLGSLIDAHEKCKAAGGEIKLVNPPGPVMKVLQITQLDRIFSIYTSIDDAIID